MPPGCLRAPPGGLGRISGALSLFWGLDVGFGSGFRVFSGLPPYPCLVDPEISSFQATWRGGLASGPPERPAADPGFLNNLVNHRKGEGVP